MATGVVRPGSDLTGSNANSLSFPPILLLPRPKAVLAYTVSHPWPQGKVCYQCQGPHSFFFFFFLQVHLDMLGLIRDVVVRWA